MLALSEEGGRRAAVLGFDLHDSNLPLKADFPVLVQNLLSWLLPDAAASVEAAGCGMLVSFVLDARSVSAWVETPDGRQSALEGNSFSDTDAPGVYRLVETLEDGQMREMAFALHIPPEESDTLTGARLHGGRAGAGDLRLSRVDRMGARGAVCRDAAGMGGEPPWGWHLNHFGPWRSFLWAWLPCG